MPLKTSIRALVDLMEKKLKELQRRGDPSLSRTGTYVPPINSGAMVTEYKGTPNENPVFGALTELSRLERSMNETLR